MKYVKWLGLGFLCLAVHAMAAPTRILKANLQVSSENTQVIVQLDREARYRLFTLSNPNRVVVDLENTVGASQLRKVSVRGSAVLKLRSSEDASHCRMVMDIVNVRDASVKLIRPGQNQRPLLVVTIRGQPQSNQPAPSQPAPQAQQTRWPVVNRQPYKIAKMPEKARDVIVVIDPGHGGKDPGASGRRHTLEKHLVLQIARELARLVEQQPGMRAVLTRTSDYYIPLRGRLDLARKYNADIFVSIHADAYRNTKSHGASVFALSQRGATSEAAHWLAEKENYSELGGVDLSELHDRDGMIRSVLIDLSQTATIGASLQLGDQILAHMNHITLLHKHKVEQARFMVLKSPDIPSVLIETGFISNPIEEMKLRNARYQREMAQSIMIGLSRYFYAHPPMGSYIAMHRGPGRIQTARL